MRILFAVFLLALAACDGTESDDGPDADHCDPCAGEPLPECADYCAPQ